MARNSNLIDLRNAIDMVYQALLRENEGGVVLNQNILDRINAELKMQISNLQSSLVEMSLVKLINDVSRRRGRSANGEAAPDLFGQFYLPPSVSIGRGRKKATSDLSLREAKHLLDARPPKPAKDPFKALRQFVLKCEESGASDEATLGSMMDRFRDSG